MSTSEPSAVSGQQSAAEQLVALRELLAQHQEIDRLQGNRIQDLEHDLILARTQLRERDNEIQRLRTQVAALSKGASA